MKRGANGVTDDPSISVFTGPELALADTVILLMKVMSMHGIIDGDGIQTVFSDLADRYRAQNLASAGAMADYLRRHAADADYGTLIRVQGPAEKSGDI
jgi:hypothetical protein